MSDRCMIDVDSMGFAIWEVLYEDFINVATLDC